MSKDARNEIKSRKQLSAVQGALASATSTQPFPRDLLTKEEFRDRLGLESTRMVDELIRRRKIPVIRLGHRTVRIPWSRAAEALLRLEIRAVGQ